VNTRSTGLPPPPPLSAGDKWAFFLDVDGTLLDFVDDPAAVSVTPALLRTLDRLHEHCEGALALVSGRAIADLDRLFGRPAWAAAGLHGFERREAGGQIERLPVDTVQRAQLHQTADALARQLPGVRVEDKGVCVALHFREAPEHGDALRLAAQALASQLSDYEVQPGNHVYELKPHGMDKGKAVIALLATPTFAGRRPVYVGDDLTDEHAFVAVNDHRGVSVRAGQREPSAATSTLADTRAVHDWLDTLAKEAHA
jgi:trehalose 6-phosphate phosphatase